MFQIRCNSTVISQIRNLIGAMALALASSAVNAAELPVFNLVIQNGVFSPTEVEVPAGMKIKLHVKNADATAEEFESSDLNREKLVSSGASVDLFLGPLEPGIYKFFGDFHPETAQGRIVAK